MEHERSQVSLMNSPSSKVAFEILTAVPNQEESTKKCEKELTRHMANEVKGLEKQLWQTIQTQKMKEQHEQASHLSRTLLTDQSD